MVIIRNRQRTVPIDVDRMHADAVCILAKLGYADYELTVIITNDATIRRYNRQFRQVDKATDVLSFPFYPDLKPGERIRPRDDEERIVGDVLLSAPYIRRAAHELGVSLDERMRVLLVHAVFHLLGYDHHTDADYALMDAEEQKMLRFLRRRSG